MHMQDQKATKLGIGNDQIMIKWTKHMANDAKKTWTSTWHQKKFKQI